MRLEARFGFWIGALIVAGLLLWLFRGVMAPFVAAFALGYLLNPIADRLERLGLSRLGATLLIMVGFLVVASMILFIVAPAVWRQLTSFIVALPDYALKLEDVFNGLTAYVNDHWAGPILDKLGIGRVVTSDLSSSTSDLVNQATQWAGALLQSAWTSGAALINVVALIVLTPVIAFYMLIDWGKMIATIESLVPPRYLATVRSLAAEIDVALAGFLRGQALVCLFLGLWYGLGFTLIGLNYGLLIGLSAGLLSFIPYVGSMTAFVLSSIIALVQGWPEWSLLLMSLGVVGVGQFIEGNILSPKLVGGSVGLHPVWLIFALLAFGALFGFAGLLIAVPCAAVIGVLSRHAVRRYRESRLYSEFELEPAQDETPRRVPLGR